MSEGGTGSLHDLLVKVQAQARGGNLRVTQHAQQEMAEENIVLDDVLETISRGHILEDYAQHRRGSCCLLNGFTDAGRAIHVVCTTSQPTLIIITVYEPKPPKWTSPTERTPSP